MLALVADQNPGNPANAFWFNFFGKAAPFVRAPESGAGGEIFLCCFVK